MKKEKFSELLERLNAIEENVDIFILQIKENIIKDIQKILKILKNMKISSKNNER